MKEVARTFSLFLTVKRVCTYASLGEDKIYSFGVNIMYTICSFVSDGGSEFDHRIEVRL